jgi:hypothetical protein
MMGDDHINSYIQEFQKTLSGIWRGQWRKFLPRMGNQHAPPALFFFLYEFNV